VLDGVFVKLMNLSACEDLHSACKDTVKSADDKTFYSFSAE